MRALLLASGDARLVPLVGAPGPARRVLELSGADQMFEIHNSVSSWLDAITS